MEPTDVLSILSENTGASYVHNRVHVSLCLYLSQFLKALGPKCRHCHSSRLLFDTKGGVGILVYLTTMSNFISIYYFLKLQRGGAKCSVRSFFYIRIKQKEMFIPKRGISKSPPLLPCDVSAFELKN